MRASLIDVRVALTVVRARANLFCSDQPEYTEDVSKFLRELDRIGGSWSQLCMPGRSHEHRVP
jgi:hypothetical protein